MYCIIVSQFEENGKLFFLQHVWQYSYSSPDIMDCSRLFHNKQNRKRKWKFSVMFVVYSLIFLLVLWSFSPSLPFSSDVNRPLFGAQSIWVKANAKVKHFVDVIDINDSAFAFPFSQCEQTLRVHPTHLEYNTTRAHNTCGSKYPQK